MSVTTLPRPADGFGDFERWEREFARTQPIGGEPLPPSDDTLRRREHRTARPSARGAAILRSMRGEV